MMLKKTMKRITFPCIWLFLLSWRLKIHTFHQKNFTLIFKQDGRYFCQKDNKTHNTSCEHGRGMSISGSLGGNSPPSPSPSFPPHLLSLLNFPRQPFSTVDWVVVQDTLE